MAPDVAVVDLNLRDGSGIDLVAALRADHPAVATVVLSGHGDLETVERVLGAGAGGYVVKDDVVDALVPEIRRALSSRTG